MSTIGSVWEDNKKEGKIQKLWFIITCYSTGREEGLLRRCCVSSLSSCGHKGHPDVSPVQRTADHLCGPVPLFFPLCIPHLGLVGRGFRSSSKRKSVVSMTVRVVKSSLVSLRLIR